ncbi:MULTISPECIES: restriction endonuclease subunit S [unclassified Streptomyces]|uniref:restriction endonuclease subunit S n=1 Tax=unclassified Streptomyces TaxID=2593676 RepID=UPI000DC76AA3|nr:MULTISPECIES: restriction endonuclease subunit S [unclassified Streptomyces]AWZ07112.1 hypothetical protein DRB89_23595 [Streptomyces sp. ICC4]AWZ14873.1 hypothetical protein DRB96_24375 [Streptomyces sp. ICC1]
MPSQAFTKWEVHRVRDLLLHHASGPSPICEEREIQESTEWGLLKTTAITWAGWNESAHKALPEEYWGIHSKEVHPGDICVTKAGPRHRVGVAAYVTHTRPRLIVSGKMILLRPDSNKVVPKYLSLALTSRPVQEYLETRKTGMAESQVNFSDRDLLDYEITLPPLGEQRKISEILDEISHSKGHHKRVLRKLFSIRKDLIRHAMSNNGEYRQSTLGELTTLIVDGVHHTPNYRESGVPFVTVENLTRGTGISMDPVRYISEEDHAIFSRRADPSAGDILVSKDGTLGVARVVPEQVPKFSIFVSVALIRTAPLLLDPQYGCMFFDSPQFFTQLRKLSSGTGLNHIHLRDFREFQLSAPDLPTQRAWSVKLGALNDAIRKEQEALDKIEKIGRSLVHDLTSEGASPQLSTESTSGAR